MTLSWKGQQQQRMNNGCLDTPKLSVDTLHFWGQSSGVKAWAAVLPVKSPASPEPWTRSCWSSHMRLQKLGWWSAWSQCKSSWPGHLYGLQDHIDETEYSHLHSHKDFSFLCRQFFSFVFLSFAVFRSYRSTSLSWSGALVPPKF